MSLKIDYMVIKFMTVELIDELQHWTMNMFLQIYTMNWV